VGVVIDTDRIAVMAKTMLADCDYEVIYIDSLYYYVTMNS